MAVLVFLLVSTMFSVGALAQADRDCGEFTTHQAVMDFWYSNGYSATNDPHDLDRDNDGLPCEVSKGEYDAYVANKKAAGGTTGGTLPNTATNNVPMMLAGAGIAGMGLLLVLRRRKVNE